MQQNNNQSKNGSSSSKGTNRLKIAHRTRSKYHLDEISLNELGSDLPDDLILENNTSVTNSTYNAPLELETPFSLTLSSSNLYEPYSNTASTPTTVEDPQDDLWMEFLTSLHQPKAINEADVTLASTSKLTVDQEEDQEDADHDDGQDDPDFTLCLDNCELDEPDYLDRWLQVPRREAILLVKDAIEFVDPAKSKANQPLSKTVDESDQIPQPIFLPAQSEQEKKSDEAISSGGGGGDGKNIDSVEMPKEKNEYVPQFTDIQRQQLDEQMRMHVQLLTQVCITTSYVLENQNIFSEARNLLSVLDNLSHSKSDELTASETKENPGTETAAKKEENLLSNQFEILNLKEAISIVNKLGDLNIQPVKYLDPRKGIPSALTELIIKSPVFYKTSLLPNNKYKYASHYKRALITDTDKILLIMGFEKFKHLPKDECCQCIIQHFLPHRASFNFKKHLGWLTNTIQRNATRKELLRKQRDCDQFSLNDFNFDRRIHYKSPYEQSDQVYLPTMYTVVIERLRLSNILKETKVHTNKSSIVITPAEKVPKTKRKARSPKKGTILALARDRGAFLRPDEAQKELEISNIENIENSVSEPANYELLDTSSNSCDTIVNSAVVQNDANDIEICIIDSDNSPIINKSKRKLNESSFNSTMNLSPGETSFQPKKFSTDRKNPANRRVSNESQNNQQQQNITITSVSNDNNGTNLFQNMASQINQLAQTPTSITLAAPPPQLNTNQAFIINPSQLNYSNQIRAQQSFQAAPSSFQIGSNLSQFGQIISIPAQIPQQQLMPQQQPMQQQQPGLIIPAGFQGTILFQPTIHMHSKNSKYLDPNKYRKITPKR